LFDFHFKTISPSNSIDVNPRSEMLRSTLVLQWLRCTTVALFEVRDIRERIRMERRRKEKARELVDEGSSTSRASSEETEAALSDDVIAQECGLMPPTIFTAEQIRHSKDVVAQLVREQREKRLAKREAFLSWQAGQREKGSAFRLARSAKKAERWKQQHSNEMGHKLISTSLHSPQNNGRNTNNDSDDHLLEVFSRVQGIANRDGLCEMQSCCDVLNHANQKRRDLESGGGATLHLSLGRGGLP
jgi:hypothetical protein